MRYASECNTHWEAYAFFSVRGDSFRAHPLILSLWLTQLWMTRLPLFRQRKMKQASIYVATAFHSIYYACYNDAKLIRCEGPMHSLLACKHIVLWNAIEMNIIIVGLNLWPFDHCSVIRPTKTNELNQL